MMKIEKENSTEMFANGNIFVFNFNGQTLSVRDPWIREMQIEHKLQDPLYVLGKRERINNNFKDNPNFKIDISMIAKSIDIKEKETNFKKFIKENMSIDDLFKIINSKIKKR